MANTIARSGGAGGGSFDFIKILLRGTGQVMFQNSAWTGLLFMIGIFWGAYAEGQGLVGWGALLGVTVSTVTGYLLGFPAKDGEQGLWGFNGVLVGCAFPTFMGNTVWMWLALALCSALTTWVRAGFNNVMAPWKVNSFTFPFVFCTWMFLLAARAMHGLPTTHMADPALPAAFSSLESIRFGDLAVYWLKGIGQVFLINSWVTGICFLAGLFLCSRWGGALGRDRLGAGAADGRRAESVGLRHLRRTLRIQPRADGHCAGDGVLQAEFPFGALGRSGNSGDGVHSGRHVYADGAVGIATLTGPFCITTWLFLLPLVRFDDEEKPDHSNWYPENKKHLAAQPAGRENGITVRPVRQGPDGRSENLKNNRLCTCPTHWSPRRYSPLREPYRWSCSERRSGKSSIRETTAANPMRGTSTSFR